MKPVLAPWDRLSRALLEMNDTVEATASGTALWDPHYARCPRSVGPHSVPKQFVLPNQSRCQAFLHASQPPSNTPAPSPSLRDPGAAGLPLPGQSDLFHT